MFGKHKGKQVPGIKGMVPEDYEVCGTCGYDHAYDCLTPFVANKIQQAHRNDPCWSERKTTKG